MRDRGAAGPHGADTGEGSLPDQQRLVLETAFHEDLTQSQITERAGLPLGTVKSRTRRGLMRPEKRSGADGEARR
ncbi:sigma factor-like helix-turn-helix DNA-binding protein [Streptomyces litmocidini]|uniref:sigma factor-like helix-turn-helix DNA-binding protein n=1 Tax=Streptomyces litmocidini TaxID=67318 RepID=UPI0035713DAE